MPLPELRAAISKETQALLAASASRRRSWSSVIRSCSQSNFLPGMESGIYNLSPHQEDYLSPPKSYIDENKIRVQREAQAKIKDLLEYGSEEDFVAAVKSWKKDISQKELLEFIDLYRAARLEKRGLSRRPR